MRLIPAFVLVAAATSLTACGTDGAGEGSGSSGPPTTSASGATPTTPASGTSSASTGGTTPTVFPDDPTISTTADRSRRVTATGTVRAFEGEGTCFTMRIEGQDYQLVGDVPGLRDGLALTVTGYADPTMATTCQAGPAFVVLTSTPG